MATQPGLTQYQREVLDALAREDVSAYDLYYYCGAFNLGPVLRSLRKRGLIVKGEWLGEDGYLYSITEAGREARP